MISKHQRKILLNSEELKDLQETLEEKNKIVDQVKKTTLKASKVLDQALKEIAVCIRFMPFECV